MTYFEIKTSGPHHYSSLLSFSVLILNLSSFKLESKLFVNHRQTSEEEEKKKERDFKTLKIVY